MVKVISRGFGALYTKTFSSNTTCVLFYSIFSYFPLFEDLETLSCMCSSISNYVKNKKLMWKTDVKTYKV